MESEWCELEGTLKIIYFQYPCNGLRHFPLNHFTHIVSADYHFSGCINWSNKGSLLKEKIKKTSRFYMSKTMAFICFYKGKRLNFLEKKKKNMSEFGLLLCMYCVSLCNISIYLLFHSLYLYKSWCRTARAGLEQRLCPSAAMSVEVGREG